MDPKAGLCDGTRLIVRALNQRYISAETLIGDFEGRTALLPRIPLTTLDDGSTPIQFTRSQFPIKLAFAMTINKAQGQILDIVGVYIPKDVFSAGQL
jgi:ATP-dependent exoDNAse (exonuclease V) alpha subunit